MKSASRSLGLLTLAAACTLLTGCSNTMTVRGKVVPGDIGIVTIVDQSDARLASTAGSGLEGVKVELRKSTTVVASAVTGMDGSFTTKLDRRASGVRYDVVATGPGIYPVRSTTYPPADGQVMLVVADQRGEAAGR